eukprot:187214-Rhodomonas_salina.1
MSGTDIAYGPVAETAEDPYLLRLAAAGREHSGSGYLALPSTRVQGNGNRTTVLVCTTHIRVHCTARNPVPGTETGDTLQNEMHGTTISVHFELGMWSIGIDFGGTQAAPHAQAPKLALL